MQSVGGGFLFLGLLAILSNKIEYKHSLVPMSIHSVFGALSILLIIMQIITGQQKLNQISISNSKIRRWHGDAGLLLWDLLCLTILLGLISFLDFSSFSGLVLILVVIVWFAVHAQMTGLKSSIMASDEENFRSYDADGPNDVVDQFSSESLLMENDGVGDNRNDKSSVEGDDGINSVFSGRSDMLAVSGAVRV